jgi:hypothetical protein
MKRTDDNVEKRCRWATSSRVLFETERKLLSAKRFPFYGVRGHHMLDGDALKYFFFNDFLLLRCSGKKSLEMIARQCDQGRVSGVRPAPTIRSCNDPPR